ncbi:hypothetical protein BGAL_0130g00200 [Botrytis galanthina]|uniref:Uncharacterized protein n=1 Tax=Botrytis galanthina TaxID=278940 RepID=A0A4S8R9I4_9HELO|nr:hypothetical protein BGAL_0130g00200 [Botrytis galanthina]
MLMGRRTTLPSAKTPLDFYVRVLHGKRVGILVDVGEAAGYDCVHVWFLELNSAEEKTLAKPESRHINNLPKEKSWRISKTWSIRKFSLGLKPVMIAERTMRIAAAKLARTSCQLASLMWEL